MYLRNKCFSCFHHVSHSVVSDDSCTNIYNQVCSNLLLLRFFCVCVCVKINSLTCSPDKFWAIIFCLDIFFHNCNDIQPYITKLTLLNMSHQHKLTWAVEFNWRQIWNGQNLIEYQKDFCKPRVLTQKKNTQLHTKRAKLKRPVMTIMSSLTPLLYDRNKRVTSTN